MGNGYERWPKRAWWRRPPFDCNEFFCLGGKRPALPRLFVCFRFLMFCLFVVSVAFVWFGSGRRSVSVSLGGSVVMVVWQFSPVARVRLGHFERSFVRSFIHLLDLKASRRSTASCFYRPAGRSIAFGIFGASG